MTNIQVFSERSRKMKLILTEKQHESLIGGLSDNMTLKQLAELHNVSFGELLKQFNMGVKVEGEHSNNIKIVTEIVKDHLRENPKYYSILKSVDL